MGVCVYVCVNEYLCAELADKSLVRRTKNALVVLDQHLGQHIHAAYVEIDIVGSQQAGAPDNGQIGGRHAVLAAKCRNAAMESKDLHNIS